MPGCEGMKALICYYAAVGLPRTIGKHFIICLFFLIAVFSEKPEEHLRAFLLCPEGRSAPHRSSVLSREESCKRTNKTTFAFFFTQCSLFTSRPVCESPDESQRISCFYSCFSCCLLPVLSEIGIVNAIFGFFFFLSNL